MEKQLFNEETTEELFWLYKKTNDQTLKQEIVLRYVDMVKTVAMQLRGVYISFTEVEDIVNEGIITLMNVIDRYDPSKNVKFESYASLRIRGMIVDLARKQDWVPRSVRKLGKEIDKTYQELYIELNRYPKDEEVAQKMGISLNKYHKIQCDSNLLNIMSLETLINGNTDEYTGEKFLKDEKVDSSPQEKIEKDELKEVLIKSIGTLKEKEQIVISLYYEKEINMKDIAKIMEISEPRVSQIHSSAIQKIKCSIKNFYR